MTAEPQIAQPEDVLSYDVDQMEAQLLYACMLKGMDYYSVWGRARFNMISMSWHSSGAVWYVGGEPVLEWLEYTKEFCIPALARELVTN